MVPTVTGLDLSERTSVSHVIQEGLVQGKVWQHPMEFAELAIIVYVGQPRPCLLMASLETYAQLVTNVQLGLLPLPIVYQDITGDYSLPY